MTGPRAMPGLRLASVGSRLVAAVVLLCLAAPVLADDAGFRVREAHTTLVDEVYRLDADVDFQLSKPVLDALDNGVPLVFEIQIQVLRQREWLWDAVDAELSQRYRLQYHALSERYLVKNLNTGLLHSYQTLAEALDAIGTIRNFPMLDERLLSPDTAYMARLRADLDIEALPTPMRVWAYVSSDWRLSSEWYPWSLQQ